MCLGVHGRGNSDEVNWDDNENVVRKNSSLSNDTSTWLPLSNFNNETIVTTQCTNTGAVIEWALVPFIVEDEQLPVSNTTEPEISVDNQSSDEL